MTDYNYIGNVSTIIKLMGMTFAGWIIAIAASHGLDLGVDASILGEVIGAFIGLGFGYIDAKHPHSLKFLMNSDLASNETVDDGEDYA